MINFNAYLKNRFVDKVFQNLGVEIQLLCQPIVVARKLMNFYAQWLHGHFLPYKIWSRMQIVIEEHCFKYINKFFMRLFDNLKRIWFLRNFISPFWSFVLHADSVFCFGEFRSTNERSMYLYWDLPHYGCVVGFISNQTSYS